VYSAQCSLSSEVHNVHVAASRVTALANGSQSLMHMSVTHAVQDSWVVSVGAGEIWDSGA